MDTALTPDGTERIAPLDRRVRRTRQRIANAYLALHHDAAGKRITVTQLAQLADINKTTFYQHYHDISDLRRSLEDQLVEDFLADVPHPEYIVSDDQRGMYELSRAFAKHGRTIFTLYAREQLPSFAGRLEQAFEQRVLARRPDLHDDAERRLMLSFLIHGSFDTFFDHLHDEDIERTVAVLNNIRSCLVRGYEPLGPAR